MKGHGVRERDVVAAHALQPRVASMVLVGYETRICDPPRKNGAELRLGVIIDMCSDSPAIGGP